MPVYSYSQLSMYEQCPLKYKLRYRDKIKRDTESIEGFLGTKVHQVLKRCYDDIRLTKLNTLDELLTHYDNLWEQDWHDSIVITKQSLTQEHYKALGKKLIDTYYKHYSPFNSDLTISTERRINFSLDIANKYKLIGYIDRLSRTRDGIYQIHDYKTSAYLPSQEEIDHDRQLGLYQIGIQKGWPDIDNIRLVWHYLAFDRELTSSRSDEATSKLVNNTIRLIDEIELIDDFPPRESGWCDWCEYPDLCPLRKHFFELENLPLNEYLNEPGVVLVNKYMELKEKASQIEGEMNRVREAIIDYTKREHIQVVKGSDSKLSVRFEKRLKFPGKNDAERQALDKIISETGKWLEVSQLDTASLIQIIKSGSWSKDLIDKVMKYGRIEESNSIYAARLKDKEK